MKNKKFSRAFIVTMTCILVACLGVAAFAVTLSAPNSVTNPVKGHGGSNPDDSKDYVNVSKDGNGLTHVEIDIPENVNQKTKLGSVRVIGDYMYVYGYYYAPKECNSSWSNDRAVNTSVPKVNNEMIFTSDSQAASFGWKRQTSDAGWGCVAVSKTKTSYADPAGVLEEAPVTWMTNAYNGCTKLTTTQANFWRLPNIPATAKHTTGIFAKCTALQRVCISTVKSIDSQAFAGCSNLWQIFIGQNVTKIASDAFSNIKSGAIFALDGASAPSGFASGWNASKGVVYKMDLSVWTLNNIKSTGTPPTLEKIS